ncbi:hypothetical protein HKX48_005428 [Thoreauomyces humboldtii]|nr:hypothetical protein HKX48_005428 [Thoreauomyces humboldtii]
MTQGTGLWSADGQYHFDISTVGQLTVQHQNGPVAYFPSVPAVQNLRMPAKMIILADGSIVFADANGMEYSAHLYSNVSVQYQAPFRAQVDTDGKLRLYDAQNRIYSIYL